MADDRLKRTEFTLRKRVECEERAFHIVNKLVDGCVDEEYLSECGKRLSQDNYDDIVEERSITKLCGYPLCDQELPNVPKKKYHISTKANKVYDISERKKFCSNQCFKASNIFKHQIPESPVWAREKEKINIAISPHKGITGLVGNEVIGERPKNILEKELETLEDLDKRFEGKGTENEENLVLREEDNFKESSVIGNEEQDSASIIASSLGEEFNRSRTDGINDSAISHGLHCEFENLDLNKNEPESRKSHAFKSGGEKPKQSSSKLEQLQQLLNKRKNVLSGMIDLQETTECKEPKDNQPPFFDSGSKTSHRKSQNVEKSTKQAEKHVKKKDASSATVQSPLCLICQVLKKWVSINSVEYLQFKSSNSESVDPVTTKFSDLQIQVNCANLSKKLDIQEKQLGSFLGDDISNSEDGEERHKEMKSIPDYKVLKDEADQYQLKVTEFITGKSQEQNKEKNDTTEDAVYIPTVDAYDQLQIRAKIVLERLDKFLPDLLIPMGLSVQDVSGHVRELVYTFRLERDTIIFKPAEWTLVSLILLKMLSFRVKAVQEAFKRDSTIRHFSVLLKGIKHTTEDIELFTRDILSDATVTF